MNMSNGMREKAGRVRAGVIGLGVGERHVAGYQEITGVEVRAICDIDPDRLASVADRHDVPERYTDSRRITEHPDLDVVSICSYDDAHAAQAVSALRHGKHVLVEKPVVLHRAEAEALLRVQQESGKLITSNLILRQSPRFREVRRMLAAGELGEVFYMEGDYIHQILWKLTKGWRGKMEFYCVTYGGGIHLVDLMRWLIDDEVVEVCGMGNRLLTRETAYRHDDTMVTLMRFSRGAMAKSLTTFGPCRTQLHALSVYGTNGTFVNDLPDAKLFTGADSGDERPVKTPYPAIEKSDLLPDFIAAIREEREPIVSTRDVFRVMDVCFAAWESVRQRRTVPVSYLV